MGIKILALGEIVGRPGLHCLKKGLKEFREQNPVDMVIANGEGAASGFGIGKNHAVQLLKLGVDVITTGEKTFYKKDMVDYIKKASYIIRPANFPAGNPGRGWKVFTVGDKKVAVVTLLGQAEFNRIHAGNPFTYIPTLLDRIRQETPIIILQFHASTTAEKNTMFFHTDGKLSAVIGTHAKALTSDAAIFPGGTAVITDTGRCGSSTGVGGLNPEVEIAKFLTQIPQRSAECWDALELQGVIFEVGDDGKATSIETVRVPVEGPQQGA